MERFCLGEPGVGHTSETRDRALIPHPPLDLTPLQSYNESGTGKAERWLPDKAAVALVRTRIPFAN